MAVRGPYTSSPPVCGDGIFVGSVYWLWFTDYILFHLSVSVSCFVSVSVTMFAGDNHPPSFVSYLSGSPVCPADRTRLHSPPSSLVLHSCVVRLIFRFLMISVSRNKEVTKRPKGWTSRTPTGSFSPTLSEQNRGASLLSCTRVKIHYRLFAVCVRTATARQGLCGDVGRGCGEREGMWGGNVWGCEGRGYGRMEVHEQTLEFGCKGSG